MGDAEKTTGKNCQTIEWTAHKKRFVAGIGIIAD